LHGFFEVSSFAFSLPTGSKKGNKCKNEFDIAKTFSKFFTFSAGGGDTTRFPNFKFRYRYRNAPVPHRDDECRNADAGCIGFDADA
jgi:hypothetical protein